jgi:Tol biopolymer transport system component
MIAFSREVIGEGLKLYVLELGLNRLRPVYSSECQGGRAPWSPNSREVMCTDGRGQTRAIVNVATGDALELFPSGDSYGCTGWSPDGTKLLCADSPGWITLDADGTNPELIIPEDGGAAWPVWLRGDAG